MKIKLIAFSLLVSNAGFAVDNSWTNGTGKWETGPNWSFGGPPSISQSGVFITNANSKTVTIDAITTNSSSFSLTISNLTVGAPAGVTNILSLSNAGTNFPLRVLDTLTVTNRGVLTLTNSALRVDGIKSNAFVVEGELRVNSGSSVVLSNANFFSGLRVGNSAGSSATFTMSGGTMSAVSNYFYAGHDAGSTGTIWMTGGSITAPNQKIDVGLSGMGQMSVSNGTISAGVLIMGELSGSRGTLNIAGGSISIIGDAVILGRLTGSTGTVWMTGGQLMESNDIGFISLEVGGGGVGQMTLSNGTVIADSIGMGDRDGGVGTLTIAGGSVVTRRFIMGSNTNTRSTLNITGGSVTFTSGGTNGLLVGNASGAVGTITQAAGQMNVLSNFNVGAILGATGTVVMSGGTNIVDGTILIGTAGGRGNLILSTNAGVFSSSGKGGGPGPTAGGGGGVLRTRAAAVSTTSGSQGTLTVSTGTVDIYSNIVVGDCGLGVAGVVEVTGGNLFVTNSTGNAVLDVRDGTLTLSSGSLQVDVLVMTNACAVFVRSGGTLLVGSKMLDANLDADGDGLPNGWEQTYGLDPLAAVGINGASGDPDGDGLSNAQEFLAGSNPIGDIKSIAKEGNDIRVRWQAAASKTNALQRAANAGGSYADVFIVTNNVGSVTNYLDVGAATNGPAFYYKIRLVP